jgi:hypothetical protein
VIDKRGISDWHIFTFGILGGIAIYSGIACTILSSISSGLQIAIDKEEQSLGLLRVGRALSTTISVGSLSLRVVLTC